MARVLAKSATDCLPTLLEKTAAAGLDARKDADGAVATLRGEMGAVKTDLGIVKASIAILTTKLTSHPLLEPVFSPRSRKN